MPLHVSKSGTSILYCNHDQGPRTFILSPKVNAPGSKTLVLGVGNLIGLKVAEIALFWQSPTSGEERPTPCNGNLKLDQWLTQHGSYLPPSSDRSPLTSFFASRCLPRLC